MKFLDKLETSTAPIEDYDREIQRHKQALAWALDKVFPSWRGPAQLSSIGEASRKMIGKPFLQGDSVSREFMDELLGRANGTWEHTQAIKVFGALG